MKQKNYASKLHHILLQIVMCISITLPITSESIANSPKKVFKESENKVFLIENIDKSGRISAIGTGFAIDNGKYIVTNMHVIKGASRIYAKQSDTVSHEIFIVASYDINLDLAVMHVDNVNSGFEVSKNAPEVGEEVFAIGNPKGLEKTLSTGIVSGIRLEKNVKYLQITAPISPGSSGGPILNSDGEVIGISTFQLKDGQNLNFAIPSTYISNIMSSQKDIKVSDLALKFPADRPIEGTRVSKKFTYEDGMRYAYGNYNNKYKLSVWENINTEKVKYKKGLSVPIYFKYYEDPEPKYVLVTQTSPYQAEPYNCHSCKVLVSVYIFSYFNSAWQALSSNRYIFVEGSSGEMPPPELQKLGKNKYGLIFLYGFMAQGITQDYITLVNLSDKISPLIDEQIGEDNYGFYLDKDSDKRYRWKTEVIIDESDKECFDIVFDSRGTKADKNGKIVTAKNTTVFRYENNKY